jgi:hypothetical protein
MVSIRATNFVRRIRGLNSGQKSVAYTLADHEHHKTGDINPSMETVAHESGYAHRRNANEIVVQLVAYKILICRRESKGRVPALYNLNYDLENCDSPVTVAPIRSRGTAVTTAAKGLQLDSNQPQPEPQSELTQPQSETFENSPNRSPESPQPQSLDSTKGLREIQERENLREGEEEAAAAAAPSVEVLSPAYEVKQAFEAIHQPPFDSRKLQILWGSFFATMNGHPMSHVLEMFFQEARRRGLKPVRLWYMIKEEFERKEVKDAIHPESVSERRSRESREGTRRFGAAVPPEPGKKYPQPIRIDNETDGKDYKTEHEFLSALQKKLTQRTCSNCEPDGWRTIDGKAVRCDHKGVAVLGARFSDT